MSRVPMTVVGEQTLRNELDRLKSVERPKVIASIAEARAHGDLKENAEYHAAREQQGFIEARIRDIEYKLSHAQIIDVASIPHTGKVIFGVTVELVNLETDEEVSYRIVGDDESDIKQRKISINSPIARSLIGKDEGDVITVETPAGVIEYELLRVQHLAD